MKLGKFIGSKFIQMNNDELENLKSKLSTWCQSLYAGTLEVVATGAEDSIHTVHLVFKLKHPIYKMQPLGIPGHEKDTISDMSEFHFLVWTHVGYLEDDPERKPLISFDMKAYTDGVYHTYRTHHRNDFKFEGAGHYMYNTSFDDLQFGEDCMEWLYAVGRGKLI